MRLVGDPRRSSGFPAFGRFKAICAKNNPIFGTHYRLATAISGRSGPLFLSGMAAASASAGQVEMCSVVGLKDGLLRCRNSGFSDLGFSTQLRNHSPAGAGTRFER